MICFVHIERAGGTTLHYIFRNNDLTFFTMSPKEYWTNEKSNVFMAEEAKCLFKLFPFIQGIGGHSTRSYLDYEKAIRQPVEYITFLRDPIARYISQFHFHRDVKNINWDIESFLNEKRFNNWITKRIAGCEDVELAKQALMEDFAFVGFTERFDESLILMKKQLLLEKFDVCYQKRNSNRPTKSLEINKSLLPRIHENNALDIELYQFARDKVYKKYVEKHGTSLESDIENLREANRYFTFSSWRRLCWGALRFFVYRRVEHFLYRKFHRQLGYGKTANDIRSEKGSLYSSKGYDISKKT